MSALLEVPVIARRLAGLLGKPALTTADRDYLAAITAFHDLGKISQGFQRAPFETKWRDRRGHIGPLLALICNKRCLPAVESAYRKMEVSGGLDRFGAMINSPLFDAVLAHHGSLPPPSHGEVAPWRPGEGYDPVEACAALVAAIAEWFPGAVGPTKLHVTPRFCHAFAGLVTLADWLGSDEANFPMAIPQDASAGTERFARSQPIARNLLRRHMLSPQSARTAAGLLNWTIDALFSFNHASAAQAAMLALPPAPESGRTCLIEDETGSGKTEAALIHFLRLFAEGAVDGMYFALPTRAAAAQIHGRIEFALQRLLGPDAPPVVLAVPGYLGRAGSGRNVLPDEAAQWPEDQADRGWASARPKRYLAACVAVGTIDQVLMGGLQVRHAQLRSGVMLRLLLVIDEVHSSDLYMLTILRGLLDQHRRAGGHALLMSATLGAQTRARLLSPCGNPSAPASPEAIKTAYPSIWSDHDPQAPLAAPARSAPAKTVGITLDPGWGDPAKIVTRAVMAASLGARVLIIRNSVRGVVEAQRALEAAAPQFSLAVPGPAGLVRAPHHARYAPEDRRRLDTALEALLGAHAPRDAGSITITSQTAEQSLDIDADLLITDLCPADVLLQRIGRLHRRADRPRPLGFEQPCLVVLTPDEATLASSLTEQGEVRRNPPLVLGLVYPDLLGIVATRRALTAGDSLVIPRDNRRLVEQATHPDLLQTLADELGGRWLSHRNMLQGVGYAQAGQARLMCLDWEKPIAPLPNFTGEIKTRLGLDDRAVDLPEGTIGPFGAPISTLTVPGRWLGSVPADVEPTLEGDRSGGIKMRFGDRLFVYDRLGLRLDSETAR
jgi:CRISPR-associated endonuclease/helicase Cas3